MAASEGQVQGKVDAQEDCCGREVNGDANARKLEVLSDDCGVAVQPAGCGQTVTPPAPGEFDPDFTTFTTFITFTTLTFRTHYIYGTINMPSRGNPNVPNKQRRVASRRKVQKKNAVNKVTKNPRGTAKSSVLHPTGGPLAPVSNKKARKLERAQNHARARAIERALEDGEAEMIGEH
jgi:hypothetical protein